MSKRKTNVEFITEVMEYSRCGALMQGFVIDSIGKMARAVLDAGEPEDDGKGLVNSQAWYQCAKELDEKLTEHYGPMNPIKEDKDDDA